MLLSGSLDVCSQERYNCGVEVVGFQRPKWHLLGLTSGLFPGEMPFPLGGAANPVPRGKDIPGGAEFTGATKGQEV